MRKLLEGRPFRHLISGHEYDQDRFGPPRSVPRSEVESLFGSYAKMEVLDAYDDSEASKRKWNIDKLTKIVTLLTPK